MVRDEIVLITGGAKGIGRAISLEFARSGAIVIFTYLSSKLEADKTLKEIQLFSKKSFSVKVDVRDSRAVKRAVGKVIQNFGRIDVLVNNAAVMNPLSFEDFTDKDFNLIVDTNLKGVFNCLKAVLPHMKSQRNGRIVNIASIAGVVGSLVNSVYGSSKAAVINLTKSLSKEFGKYGITINCVSPGPIATDMLKNVDKKVIQKVISDTPLGELTKMEDIARAVKFFSSKDSEFITGQNLVVDGGRI